MRCISFIGGALLGAAAGSVASMILMPSRKSRHILGKTLRNIGDVIDGVSNAIGW